MPQSITHQSSPMTATGSKGGTRLAACPLQFWGTRQPMSTFTPPLTVQELPGRVRLCLGTLTHGTGPTLQDAADDLVQRLLSYAITLRTSGLRTSTELGPPDLAALGFLHELGEIAATGGDIRQRLFG